MRFLTYLWAAPTTLLGLLAGLFAVLSGGQARRVAGVLEISGGFATWLLIHIFGAGAVTLGHVVLGRNPRILSATRRHERAHVLQAERWGPLFLPAYLASSCWCWLRGRHHYYDNVFEREARRYERAEPTHLPEGPGLGPHGSGPRCRR